MGRALEGGLVDCVCEDCASEDGLVGCALEDGVLGRALEDWLLGRALERDGDDRKSTLTLDCDTGLSRHDMLLKQGPPPIVDLDPFILLPPSFEYCIHLFCASSLYTIY